MRMRSTFLVAFFVSIPAVGCDAEEPDAIDIEFRPHVPICPTCPIKEKRGKYYQTIDIDEEYASSTITDPALTFIDPVTQDPLTVSMAPMSVSSTGTTEIDLTEYELEENQEVVSDWLGDHTSVTTARLSLQVDDDGSGPNQPQTLTEDIDVIH